MYTPGDHPEGNSQIRRASIFDPFADFSQMSRSRKAVTGSPAAAEAGSPAVAAGAAATGNAEAAGGEKGIYEDPKKIKKVWAQRHLTYCELQEEEDEERLRLLYQIVHEVYRQFGGKWSNEVNSAFVSRFSTSRDNRERSGCSVVYIRREGHVGVWRRAWGLRLSV